MPRHSSSATRRTPTAASTTSAHNTFGVWSCHELQEVNTQQFQVDAIRADRFCLLSEPSRCLLPASASPLFY